MRVERVQTPEQVERLRDIRNSCRSFMTHDTEHVTPEQQAEWWDEAPREAYLFDNVAFGYISRRDGKLYITLGAYPGARGKGYGRAVYLYCAYRAFTDHGELLWADVNHANVPSINAAAKAGWTIHGVDGHKVVMHS